MTDSFECNSDDFDVVLPSCSYVNVKSIVSSDTRYLSALIVPMWSHVKSWSIVWWQSTDWVIVIWRCLQSTMVFIYVTAWIKRRSLKGSLRVLLHVCHWNHDLSLRAQLCNTFHVQRFARLTQFITRSFVYCHVTCIPLTCCLLLMSMLTVSRDHAPPLHAAVRVLSHSLQSDLKTSTVRVWTIAKGLWVSAFLMVLSKFNIFVYLLIRSFASKDNIQT